jgi:hypothetical protein
MYTEDNQEYYQNTISNFNPRKNKLEFDLDTRPLQTLNRTFSKELSEQIKTKRNDDNEFNRKSSTQDKDKLNNTLEFYQKDLHEKKATRNLINNSLIYTNLKIKNEKKMKEKVGSLIFIF